MNPITDRVFPKSETFIITEWDARPAGHYKTGINPK
jgi:hypothetical protein